MSRNQDKLDNYCEHLRKLGIEAKGFAADVYNKEQLIQALSNIKAAYGFIDVLEYSPYTGNMPVTSVLDTTGEAALDQFNGLVIGAINSVQQVLPDMLEQGTGALLFTTDLSSINPTPILGNVGIAMAALRNYVLNLHVKLSTNGILLGHLAISPLIKRGTDYDPDYVAQVWYRMYEQKLLKEETYPAGILQRFNL